MDVFNSLSKITALFIFSSGIAYLLINFKPYQLADDIYFLYSSLYLKKELNNLTLSLVPNTPNLLSDIELNSNVVKQALQYSVQGDSDVDKLTLEEEKDISIFPSDSESKVNFKSSEKTCSSLTKTTIIFKTSYRGPFRGGVSGQVDSRGIYPKKPWYTEYSERFYTKITRKTDCTVKVVFHGEHGKKTSRWHWYEINKKIPPTWWWWNNRTYREEKQLIEDLANLLN